MISSGQNRRIELSDRMIEYRLKKSQRAKRLRVAVYCDTSIVVTLPQRMNENAAENFLLAKAAWLLSKIKYFQQHNASRLKSDDSCRNSQKEFKEKKEEARQYIASRLSEYNKIYDLKFNKVSIRKQKTRWGSCSRQGNLNFNYKLIFLPAHLADYIIVHELCHLEELNHSDRFWALVARTVPDYSAIKKELRSIRL